MFRRALQLSRRARAPCQSARCMAQFSTSKPEAVIEDSPPSIQDQAVAFGESVLKGLGAVVFQHEARSGLFVLGGLTLANPAHAGMALVGCTSATGVAKALGFDRTLVREGHFGFNGALVGCLFSAFLGMGMPQTAAATMIGGGCTAILFSGLNKIFPNHVPQFVIPFNAVALSTLAFVRPLENAAPALAEKADVAMEALAAAPLSGISHIFVIENPYTGLLVLAAMAFPRAMNWEAPVHAIGGSIVGCLTAAAIGVPLDTVAQGVCAYNPALTALAVSTFLKPCPQTIALAGGGAALTAGLTAAMVPVAASTLAIPVATSPFCIMGCAIMAAAPKHLRR